ncbi:MAG: Transcriptional regulator [Moraxellaceae bacterium]|jgi:AcrR family transcriptional regulator|nr:Transcriptional regulator [Moraxellaceae bacterium]
MKKALPRTRDAAKQETREALLQAAMELFRSDGLDASLDAVCARAGYTRGAFYVHFQDREALISAVIERVGFTLIDTLLGAEDNEEDFLVLVQRFLNTVAAGHYPIGLEGDLRLYQLLDACARSETVRLQYLRLHEAGITRLAAALRRAQERGELRADADARQMAQMLMGLVLGMQTMLELAMPFDLPGMARTLLVLMSPAGNTK